MPAELRFTFRFLQPYFHGRGEDGSPEWPPSPLRAFQALTASALGREVDPERRARGAQALRWLERQPPPEIVAPPANTDCAPFRLYVPDNVGDICASAWSKGRSADLSEFRSEKDVRPIRIEEDAIHYVFRTSDGLDPDLLRQFQAMARSVTNLGWGIDLVAGDANAEASAPAGERWIPGRPGGVLLRCPCPGTLDDLERKHSEFLGRLEGGMLRPVTPLTRFGRLPYARATDATARPHAAFRLLDPDTGDRLWLEPERRARDVAAWLRHAVAAVCEGWPFGSTSTLVHGHGLSAHGSRDTAPRLSFLPLPTINPRLRRVEGLNRVLVAGPHGSEEQLAWIGARLAGRVLEWKGEPVALLDPLPPDDWVLSRYAGISNTWSTVTPVILPGHDDRSGGKSERLLRKALLQAGFSPEQVDGLRELDWRKTGFRAGTESAGRYAPPDKVAGPMFHVRLRLGAAVPGPVALGSGRFRGVGLLAAE